MGRRTWTSPSRSRNQTVAWTSWMPSGSDVEEAARGEQGAADAEHHRGDDDPQAGEGHVARVDRERLQQLEPVALVEQVVDPPAQQEHEADREHAAQQALDEALEHERDADEPVGG